MQIVQHTSRKEVCNYVYELGHANQAVYLSVTDARLPSYMRGNKGEYCMLIMLYIYYHMLILCVFIRRYYASIFYAHVILTGLFWVYVNTVFIPCGQFRLPFLGEATAAARAGLCSPVTSQEV